MLSLAPLRYRAALDPGTGPILRVETAPITVLGERQVLANAFLRPGLVPVRQRQLYGTADGSGTHATAVVARHLAVSEALERWAFHEASHGPDRARYGFDIDPSSNGMAAFPGAAADQARRHAWLEAIERHSLIGWWHGSIGLQPIPSPWRDVEAWEFGHGFARARAVLVHRQGEPGMHAYGHAAADRLDDALRRAATELARCELVLRRHRALHPVHSAIDRGRLGLFERRCLYFSTPAGHAEFRARLGPAARPADPPRVVFDGAVPGPWTEFATVWRAVLEPPTPAFLDPERDWFFW